MQQSLAAEQVTREAVSDGERIAVDAVACAELAFEVGSPDEVGSRHHRHGATGMTEATSTTSVRHQAVAFQDVADGASSWRRESRVPRAHDRQELLGAPRRMTPTNLEDRVNDTLCRSMRARARTTRSLEKT